jgi:regulatory protein
MAGKITALKVQARNKQRVNVYLDGEFAFGLAAIEAARLKIGQSLSEADLARLRAADEVEQTYERALQYLSYRPRSEAEIRRRLSRKTENPAALDEALARLRRAGLVDDKAFGQLWVENRAQFRPRSRRMLKAELRQKGLSAEQAEAALAAVPGGDGEAAYQAATGRAGRLRALPRQEFFRRMQGFLGRRGFDYETIRETVERVWREAVEQGLAADALRESEE